MKGEMWGLATGESARRGAPKRSLQPPNQRADPTKTRNFSSRLVRVSGFVSRIREALEG